MCFYSIAIPCNQWGEPACPIFFFWGRSGWCWIFRNFVILNVFSLSSQCVPIKVPNGFPTCFPSSKFVPQHVPNSTSICPICIAQHSPLWTNTFGPILCLCHMCEVITSVFSSPVALRFFVFDGSIKEAHCTQKRTNKRFWTWKALHN